MNGRKWPPTGLGTDDNPLTNSLYNMGILDNGGNPLPPDVHGLLLSTGDFVLLGTGGIFLLTD